MNVPKTKLKASELTPKLGEAKHAIKNGRDSITKNWNPINVPDYVGELKALESQAYQPFQLLDPEKLYVEGKKPEDYPKWTDPFGRECHARVMEVRWPGKVKNGIRESYNLNLTKLREGIGVGLPQVPAGEGSGFELGGPDSFAFGAPYGGQLAYPPGPFTRQLYLWAMWQMQARCFELKNHDGVAKGLIQLVTAFVIGEGVKMQFDDDKAQEVWDEFAERTRFEQRLPTHCDMLSCDGELFYNVKPLNSKPGFADLLTIDAGTVWEVITEPKNIFNVKGYWVQYPTQYQLYTVGGVPIADYIVEVVPPEQVVHLKINTHENEKRGRSDLQAVMGDIKLLNDIIRYRAVRVLNEAALVFDQTVTGQDTDVSEIANVQTSLLGAGTTHTHNESVKLEIKQATAQAQGKSGFQDEMLAKIGMGTGNLPSDYVAAGAGGSNRASALTKVEPAYKFFLRRQKTFEFGLREVARKVIAIAKSAGRLGKDVDDKVEVIFPEIAPEDRKDKMAAIVLMESQQYWDHEKAATVAAKEMDDTTYDYDDTQEKIKKERLEDPQLAYLFQPTAPGVIGSTPNPGAAPNAVKPGAGVQDKSKADTAAKIVASTPSKSQYGGDKAGLSSSSVKQVKNSIKSKQSEAQKLGRTKQTKKAHGAIHRGLRSRTKHTLHMAEETNAGSAFPAQMRKGFDEAEFLKCASSKEFKKHPYATIDWKESAPPGWEDTVKKMKGKPGIDNPFALSWWMDNQGYSPK